MINYSKNQLQTLSRELLHLHKALLNFEQKEYEGQHGKISGPNKLLELLTSSKHFAWLRVLSQLIVGLDELVDSKQPPEQQQMNDLVKYTRALITSSNTNNEFSKKYFAALQKDPHVALTHGKVIGLIKA